MNTLYSRRDYTPDAHVWWYLNAERIGDHGTLMTSNHLRNALSYTLDYLLMYSVRS